MAWKSVTYEDLDLKDGRSYEIYVTSHELVEVPARKKKEEPRTANKFFGLDRNHGPVAFLTTDHLAEKMGGEDAVGHLFAIQWKGKRDIKGGKTFNVFSTAVWEGPLPEWVTGEATETE